jgi:hypothetical protein
MPGAQVFGVYGALFVEFPLLLILCAGAFVLSRRWLSPLGAAFTSLLVGLNVAVLGYSVMLNFALAATAAVLWCFAAYARSNRFSSLKWSIAFGLAFALLLLTRSMAPVYAVPMALFVALDVLVGVRRYGQRVEWPALAAVGTTLVVAGPWWLVSGHEALHYLRSAGYQASSGYTSRGVDLTPATVVTRIRYELSSLGWLESVALAVLVLATLWIVLRHSQARRLSGAVTLAAWVVVAHELMNLGWLESVALGVLVLAGLWILVTHSRARPLPGLWILAAWVVATLLVLSSSANFGTGFGLPLLAVTIVVCAVVVGATIEFGLPVLATCLVVLLAVGGASQFTSSTNIWWHGPPYRGDVEGAGGSFRTNVDQMNAQVAASLGRGEAMEVVNPGLINVNALDWYGGPSMKLSAPWGSGSTAETVSMMPHVRSLVLATSWGPYGSPVDLQTIERAAFRSGLHPARVWGVTEGVSVILWNRGPHVSHSVFDPSMVKPRNGSVLTEAAPYLVAATPSDFGASKVTFLIAGNTLSHPLPASARPFIFGWIAPLNVGSLAQGKYTITCVAENAAGVRTSSPAITVYVH